MSIYYNPPDVSQDTDDTQYDYDLDRQVESIAEPNGRTLQYAYDNQGRVDSLTIGAGVIDYVYDDATGKIKAASSPYGDTGIDEVYQYDGGVMVGQTWDGSEIEGSIQMVINDDFLIATSRINNANTINFQYDDDRRLLQAGDMTVTNFADSGFVKDSTLDNITTVRSYNEYGDPASLTSTYNSATIYEVSYQRDKLSSIETKTETIGGTTTVYTYAYDSAGRLEQVKEDGIVSESYTYDNRFFSCAHGGDYDLV